MRIGSRRLPVASQPQHPTPRLILFGSHARGNIRPDSDLDLLVIEPEVKSRRAEYVRLRDALGNLGVPIDLVIVPASLLEEWGHFEGTMLNDALREGRVLIAPGEKDQTGPNPSPSSCSSSRTTIRVRAVGSSYATTSQTRSRSTPEVVVSELVSHPGNLAPWHPRRPLPQARDTRFAASPAISRFLTTASWIIGETKNSPRPDSAYASARSMASRIWSR
jgi:predicted nucleotidyltransferase